MNSHSIELHPVHPLEAPNHGEGGESLADWATISIFEVQVNQRSKITARVYANLYQQVPVQIVIEARDKDGVVVSLSASQLKSIRLIDYHTGATISGVTDFKDKRFIYDWDPVREDGSDVDLNEDESAERPGTTSQTMMFYVMTAHVSTAKVAAEITSPSGATFRTNTPDPSPGKFDSWVNIQGVQKPLYDHSDLTIERVNEVTNSDWDVDLYYIKFAKEGLRIVDSLHIDVSGDWAHVMKMPVLLSPRMHIAFQVGERRTVSFAGQSTAGVQFVVNQREGQATAARCTYTGLTGYFEETRWVKACVWYINQYGNMAKCSLSNTYTDDYNTIWLEGVEHG